MELDKFLSARYLAPPTISLLFIVLANPARIIEVMTKQQGTWITVFAGWLLLFGAGYYISSIATALIINPAHLRQTLSKELKERARKSKHFRYLSRSRPLTDTEAEVIGWEALREEEYIRGQLDKRWHAFNASVNSGMALAMAVLIIAWFHIEIIEKRIWWPLFTVSVVIFICLAVNTHGSVKEIDNIMVAKLLAREEDQEEPKDQYTENKAQ